MFTWSIKCSIHRRTNVEQEYYNKRLKMDKTSKTVTRSFTLSGDHQTKD